MSSILAKATFVSYETSSSENEFVPAGLMLVVAFRPVTQTCRGG